MAGSSVLKTLRRTTGRLLLLLFLLLLAYESWVFVRVLWWSRVNPGMTSFMSLRLDELRETDPTARLMQHWLPYDSISSQLKRAVVAAEDDRFLDHEGFDWEGIQQAMEKNLQKGHAVAGGSTISQQLAKNLFLTPSRSLLRKGQEAFITLLLESFWSKRRILEVYLNVVEWGEGVFGAEAAALHYYGVGARHLDAWQSARLAVMLPNPRSYGRNFTARLSRHAASVQARMQASQVP